MQECGVERLCHPISFWMIAGGPTLLTSMGLAEVLYDLSLEASTLIIVSKPGDANVVRPVALQQFGYS